MENVMTESENIAQPDDPVYFVTEELKQLRGKIQVLETDLFTQRSHVSEQANQIYDLNKKLKLAESESSAGAEAVRELNADNARLREQLISTDKEQAVLREKAANLEGQIARYMDANSKLQLQLQKEHRGANELRSKLNRLESEQINLKSVAKHNEIENSRLERELAAAFQAQKLNSELYVQYLAERDDLKHQLKKMESLKSEAEAVLQIKSQAFEIDTANFKKEVEEKNEQLRQLQKSLEQLTNANKRLSAEVQTQKLAAANWEKRHQEAVESYDGEFGRLSEIAEKSESELKAKDEEIAKIQSSFELKLKELEELKKEKDVEIEILRDELHKAKEDIRIKDEMYQGGHSIFSPAAQETLSLLKDAPSLTEIYAAHIDLKAELAKKVVLLQQAEKTLTKLREAFQAQTPILRQRTAQYEEAILELKHTTAQLKQYKQERDQVLVAQDASQHELQFTKDELERYQRDYRALSEQIQHLLKEKQEPSENPLLFADIKELQLKNRELVSRLNTMESEKESALKAAEDKKFKELKDKLVALEQIRDDKDWQLGKMNTLVNDYKEQLKRKQSVDQHAPPRTLPDLEVNRLKSQLHSLESQLKCAEFKAETFEKRFTGLANTQTQRETQWTEQKTSLTAQIERLTKDSNEKHAEISQLKQKIQELTIQIKRHAGQHQDLALRLEFVSKKRDEIFFREQQKDKIIDELRDQNRTLDLNYREISHTNALFKAQLTEFAKKFDLNSDLKASFSDFEALINRQEAKTRQEIDQKLAELTSENQTLKSTNLELNLAKEKLENDLKLLKLELESEVKRLKFELEHASISLDPVKNENSELKEKLKKLTEELLEYEKTATESSLFYTNNLMLVNEVEILKYQLDATARLTEYWKSRWEADFNLKIESSGEIPPEEKLDYSDSIRSLFNEAELRIQETNDRLLDAHTRQMELEMEKQNLEAAISEINKKFEAKIAEYEEKLKKSEEKVVKPVKREHNEMEVDEIPAKIPKIELDFDLEDIKGQLEQRNNELKLVNDQFEDFQKIAESERIQLQEEINHLKNEKSALWQRTEQIINEVRTKLEQSPENLETSELLNVLRQELANETAQRLQLLGQNEVLRRETQDCIAAQLHLRTELKKLNSDLTAATAQTQQIKLNASKKIDEANALLAEKQRNLDQLKANFTKKLEEQTKDVELELSTLKQKVSEQENELKIVKDEKEKIANELEKKNEECGKVKALAVKFREELKSARAQKPAGAAATSAAATATPAAPATSSVVAASFSQPAVSAPSRTIEPPKPTPPRAQRGPQAGVGRVQQQILRNQGAVRAPAPAQPLYGQNKARILKLEEENKDLTTKLSAQTSEAQTLKEKLTTLESQIKERELRIAALEKRISELEEEKEDLQGTIEADKMRHEMVESSYAKARQTINELKEQIKQLETAKEEITPN
ncbi:unnamed protein product [Bursaphelenchus xylophilus]|uniref:(pine wood nematode) hypothetical protein n=1 Tax=Bursaphelenchus xylophilus TaxID=6326 RepID=A0A1I7SRR5_BURXY|nr:unnamed protein product [Bursaphelenchus xylophilus]CAG9101938.1 unnamed protein product [Bursaphelenchus xylophilus]